MTDLGVPGIPGQIPPPEPNQSDQPQADGQFDPAQALQRARDEAAAKRAQQLLQEQAADEAVADYRTLLNDREKVATQFGMDPIEARGLERKQTELLELSIEQQHIIEAQRISAIPERVASIEANLAKLQRGQQTLIDSRSTALKEGVPQADLDQIDAQTREHIATQQTALNATKAELNVWQAEVERVTRPILDALGETTPPKSTAEIDQLMARLGETIQRNEPLSAQARELLDRLDEIDTQILDLLHQNENGPSAVVDRIYDHYRKEQSVRTHFASVFSHGFLDSYTVPSQAVERFDYKVRTAHEQRADSPGSERAELERALSQAHPNAHLAERLADTFLDCVAQTAGLNSPELTLQQRESELTHIAQQLEQAFEQVESFWHKVTSNSGEYRHKYRTLTDEEHKRARADFDGLFLAYLTGGIGTADHADGAYGIEASYAVGSGSQYQSEHTAHIAARIQPFFKLFEVMQAAVDAEETVRRDRQLKPVDQFFTTSLLPRSIRAALAGITDYNKSAYRLEKPYGRETKALLPFISLGKPASELTPEQQDEQAQLIATYNETYTFFVREIQQWAEEQQRLLREREWMLTEQLVDLKSSLEQSKQELTTGNELHAHLTRLAPYGNLPVKNYMLQELTDRRDVLQSQLDATSRLSFLRRKALGSQVKEAVDAVDSALQEVKRVAFAIGFSTIEPDTNQSAESILAWHRNLQEQVTAKLNWAPKASELQQQIQKIAEALEKTQKDLNIVRNSPWYKKEESPQTADQDAR